MCDYSVVFKPRRGKAKKDEELTLVNFADHSPMHVVRGFASLMDLEQPVCMCPGTKLRYMGLQPEQSTLVLPTEGVAEFIRAEIVDPYTTHDALKFDTGLVVKLVHLKPGMQVRVISVPAEKGGESKLSQTSVRASEPVYVGHT